MNITVETQAGRETGQEIYRRGMRGMKAFFPLLFFAAMSPAPAAGQPAEFPYRLALIYGRDVDTTLAKIYQLHQRRHPNNTTCVPIDGATTLENKLLSEDRFKDSVPASFIDDLREQNQDATIVERNGGHYVTPTADGEERKICFPSLIVKFKTKNIGISLRGVRLRQYVANRGLVRRFNPATGRFLDFRENQTKISDFRTLNENGRLNLPRSDTILVSRSQGDYVFPADAAWVVVDTEMTERLEKINESFRANTNSETEQRTFIEIRKVDSLQEFLAELSYTGERGGDSFDAARMPRSTASQPLGDISSHCATLGEMANRLGGVLRSEGYNPIFRATQDNNGFAVVTNLQRFNIHDGSHHSARTRVDHLGYSWDEFSAGGFILALLRADAGYYRTFIFLVTSENVNVGGADLEWDTARQFTDGSVDLEPQLRDNSCNARKRLYALVYEYERKRSDPQSRFRTSSDLSACDHLRQANLRELSFGNCQEGGD